ncbi:DUF4136 domain-containing protein [Flavisphingomonas formosensis]|uniref:DUF4136 domain-containing protein n=1 Tax=Flavisphingomonas formosensis TaxID=861534 RepID=UPI0012FA91A5|nr:DUF4136 domain-containing protein [Sphingomonas formosensis]
MALNKKIFSLAAPVALLALSACATPFQADVARFQAMPAPQGQSFVIQPANPANEGGLEFAQYAAIIAQRLTSQGYAQASDPKSATLVVMVDYGVDHGVEKIQTTPGFGPGPGWGGWGWGRPYGWGGWGGWRGRYYMGWGDPFWGWDYPDVSSYTVYTSHLDMQIKRTVDGQSLFEGHAKAHSRGDKLTELVPNLVEAMFTNFPGRSGETVKITIAPPDKK